MKIAKIIKAFFTKDNDPVELDLVAAEIKEGRAYLHTKGEESTTYLIRSNDIRILFDVGKSISGQKVYALLTKKEQTLDDSKKGTQSGNANQQQYPAPTALTAQQPQLWRSAPEFEKYKKRTFSVSLYPDEYDLMIASMKEFGYKRADFLMACVQSAKKTSLEKAHKQIIKSHKQILQEQKSMIAQRVAKLESENHTA